MRRILFILLMAISFIGYSQIVMEPLHTSRVVGHEWRFVKIFDLYVVEPIPIAQDSVIYTFDGLPTGVALSDLGELKKGHEIVGDTMYKFTNKIRIDLSYSRRE